MAEMPRRIVVMGVTGCGKTTVGALLAGRQRTGAGSLAGRGQRDAGL